MICLQDLLFHMYTTLYSANGKTLRYYLLYLIFRTSVCIYKTDLNILTQVPNVTFCTALVVLLKVYDYGSDFPTFKERSTLSVYKLILVYLISLVFITFLCSSYITLLIMLLFAKVHIFIICLMWTYMVFLLETVFFSLCSMICCSFFNNCVEMGLEGFYFIIIYSLNFYS